MFPAKATIPPKGLVERSHRGGAQGRGGRMCEEKLERKMWVHEDHLLDHRITWLILAQTILMSAYGAILYAKATAYGAVKDVSCNDGIFGVIHALDDASALVPIVGFWLSFLTFIGVLGAVIAMIMLRHRHETKNNRLCVGWYTTFLGIIPPMMIPSCFALAWGVIGRGLTVIPNDIFDVIMPMYTIHHSSVLFAQASTILLIAAGFCHCKLPFRMKSMKREPSPPTDAKISPPLS